MEYLLFWQNIFEFLFLTGFLLQTVALFYLLLKFTNNLFYSQAKNLLKRRSAFKATITDHTLTVQLFKSGWLMILVGILGYFSCMP